MNSNKENNAHQSTFDENEIASYEEQKTNKEKCGRSKELPINKKTQSESTKGKIWNQ